MRTLLFSVFSAGGGDGTYDEEVEAVIAHVSTLLAAERENTLAALTLEPDPIDEHDSLAEMNRREGWNQAVVVLSEKKAAVREKLTNQRV